MPINWIIVSNMFTSTLTHWLIFPLAVTRLLDPPRDCDYNLVQRVLEELNNDEYSAVKALLPLFNILKDGEDASPGRNTTQHPQPTIKEAVTQIEQSSLTSEQKNTLAGVIARNPLSSTGVALFLPSDSPTEASDLEGRIHELKAQLDTFSA